MGILIIAGVIIVIGLTGLGLALGITAVGKYQKQNDQL